MEEKKINDTLKSIKKQFGDESIMLLGDNPSKQVDSISSGSLLIDRALGIGGFPKGRIIEIFGPESSGKTTLALHALAEVQREGGTAAFIDAENALDPKYARNLGVNIDELILSQPDSGEQALEITDTLIKSNAVDIIIIDSVAALVPQAELDGEMHDQTIGAQARLMSKALRKMTSVINQSNCIVIFINQLREKVGVVFGNPETTTGGRALKFYSSIRIDIRRSEIIKDGNDIIGTKSKVKVVKNKTAPPFKLAIIDILYGKGISKVAEVIDLAVEYEIIDKSGVWYAYKGNKIGQGREKTKLFLEDNNDLFEEIHTELLKAMQTEEDTLETQEIKETKDKEEK
ncbi:MAG: recombinase RecA [Mycoplasmatales bacterium]